VAPGKDIAGVVVERPLMYRHRLQATRVVALVEPAGGANSPPCRSVGWPYARPWSATSRGRPRLPLAGDRNAHIAARR